MKQLTDVAEVLASAQDDKEAWLKERGNWWTGTAIAQLMDMYETRKRQGAAYPRPTRDLAIKEKAIRFHDPSISEVAAVEAGYFLEPGIGAWYQKCAARLGLSERVEDSGNVLLTSQLTRPYQVATTLDWVEWSSLGILSPVEIKNISWKSAQNWHYNTAVSGGDHSTLWPARLGRMPRPHDVQVVSTPINTKVAAGDESTPRGRFRQWGIDFYQVHLPAMGDLVAPWRYWVQLQVQMAVLGAPYGRLVSCHGGDTLIIQTFQRHDAFLAEALDQARSAWEEVTFARMGL